jgi:CRISPR system Cascade subunit CasB
MATTQTKSSDLEQESKFLQAVENRTKKDNGAKAAFKRAMSGDPEHVRRIYQFVLPYVGNASEWEQNNIWIPIACLLIYYPQAIAAEHRRNFGYSCRRLASEMNSEGAERRFRALLDLSLIPIFSEAA